MNHWKYFLKSTKQPNHGGRNQSGNNTINLRVNELFLVHLYQRIKQARNQPRNQRAYTLLLVYLPYYTNKAIIIHVFYRPWHQYWTIWVTNIRRNISSGVIKSLFWRFRIKDECNSAVISFWDITKKKPKKTQLLYWGMAYSRTIWYISECVLLSDRIQV